MVSNDDIDTLRNRLQNVDDKELLTILEAGRFKMKKSNAIVTGSSGKKFIFAEDVSVSEFWRDITESCGFE